MSKPKKSTGWGGYREGGGRPPIEGGSKPITIRLSGKDLQSLESLAESEGTTPNAKAKEIIQGNLDPVFGLASFMLVWRRDERSEEGTDDPELFKTVADSWYQLANKHAKATVLERRCFDEEGDPVREVYAHLELLSFLVEEHPQWGIAYQVFVCPKEKRKTFEKVKAWWISQDPQGGSGVEARQEGGDLKLLVRTDILKPFYSTIHKHQKN